MSQAPTPLGRRIARARKRKKLSRKALADAVKVDQSTLWRWEEAGQPPGADQIAKLARQLGVSTDHLLFGASEDKAS